MQADERFAYEEQDDPKINWVRGTSIEIQVGRLKQRLKIQWDRHLGAYIDLDETRLYFTYHLNHRTGHEELHLTDRQKAATDQPTSSLPDWKVIPARYSVRHTPPMGR